MLRAHILHSDGRVDCDVEQSAALQAPANATLWYDISSPTEKDRELLRTVWHFHPLAIEALDEPHRRSRLERFPGHDFLVVQSLDHTTPDFPVDLTPIFLFVRSRLIVSVHNQPSTAEERVFRWLKEDPDHVGSTVDRLINSLLDAVIDEFHPVLDKYERVIDQLAELAPKDPSPHVAEQIMTIRRNLLQVRRGLPAYQEVLRRMLDRDRVSPEEALLLRDLLDHVAGISESVGVLIDTCNGALDMHTAAANERMNKVMKYLAIVSTLLLPMTVISGAFGMNFSNIPGSDFEHGFWIAVSAMTGSGMLLLLWFRVKRWF